MKPDPPVTRILRAIEGASVGRCERRSHYHRSAMTSPPDPRPGGAPPTIHLACSRGGHLDILLRYRGAFDGYRCVWVTQHSARAKRLQSEGARVHVIGEWHGLRGIGVQTLLTLWRSLGLVLRQRPRVVVTSGSGIVVPFCVMARITGAHVIFVETAARVRGASRSGRVLSRIAQQVVAQWKP